MDFSYSKTEQLFLQMIRSFAENEVKPLAAEVDEQERFPMETVEKMGKLGLMGIPIPKQYGGAGGTVQMYIMAVEELSRVCATTGVVLSAHTSLCMAPILENGTEEQKMKYLPKLASGEWIGAFGLTEPNAGTDAAMQQTTAVDAGDKWILQRILRQCVHRHGHDGQVEGHEGHLCLHRREGHAWLQHRQEGAEDGYPRQRDL
ncbi:MAG: acyl-CoA dehydrogenase, short-chain specific [bacterium P3]|nr:MAG: acyl-CoA dehydrogenase, short-chain specific [bacterium P3]